MLTRSPGSEAAKSHGIRTNPERSGHQYANQFTHTAPNYARNANSPSLSLNPSPGSFLFLSASSCVGSAAAPGADVSINCGTRRPSRLISIHSRHTCSMCHEIIGRSVHPTAVPFFSVLSAPRKQFLIFYHRQRELVKSFEPRPKTNNDSP